MSETTYYSDRGVRITNARAIFGPKTYALANISSVQMGVIPAKRAMAILVALGGLCVTTCMGLSALGALLNRDSAGVGAFISIATLLPALVMAGGIYFAVTAKPTYTVRLAATSGEAQAMASTDKVFVQGLVDALNEAIVHRG